MIFYWLIFSVGLAILVAGIVLMLTGAEEAHEEEAAQEERVIRQQAAITVAHCEADPDCKHAHERAVERFARWVKNHAKE